jgi:hypothetical protein
VITFNAPFDMRFSEYIYLETINSLTKSFLILDIFSAGTCSVATICGEKYSDRNVDYLHTMKLIPVNGTRE